MARYTVTLGFFVALLVSCSDDNSGTGNADTDPDVVIEVGPADNGGDQDADSAADGAGDVARELDGEPDLVLVDADANLGGDTTDTADVADDTADERHDLIIPDLPSDVNEFDICPYDTDSATADCETLCGAVGDCSGEDAEAGCLSFCEIAKSLVTQATGDALSTCVSSTVCEDLPDEVPLSSFCLNETLESLEDNPTATAACNAVDAAIETCEGGDSDFDAECGTVAPTFRSEAVSLLEACAEVACNRISECVSAVVCDILL